MKFVPDLTPIEVEKALGAQFHSVQSIPRGIGGQGVVFRATARNPKQDIALKIYFPGAIAERTHREVRSLSLITAQSLVRIYSEGKAMLRGEECLFLATNYIAGDLLAERIAKGAIDWATAAKLGRDMSSAINAMWTHRIVHRDIKPSNIILTPASGAVLFDLGVARHLSMDSLTSIGKTWGTNGYMSPEQMRALRQLSCKSDIFSLGITLQEALLGRHPAGGNQALLANGGPSIGPLRRDIPSPLANLITAMVARDAHNRPTPTFLEQEFEKWS